MPTFISISLNSNFSTSSLDLGIVILLDIKYCLNSSLASSGVIYLSEYTYPAPSLENNGIFQHQPLDIAVQFVYP